ncbi:hypothetical protein LTR56_023032 [Elasticomyces elasticus]|nr:hypothetical protein LTR56_023032 [Elasticomyces elasticus]KAK3629371.1 hypothetical protein LTR22_021945 [Elasticomyces elasticus]KAK4908738.1 hypothetical protein LTR49_022407 [Elasticomyces elasticus]KAK5748689.1 hypothetical protein LTS12_021260 [Elasticomyces elasticus]
MAELEASLRMMRWVLLYATQTSNEFLTSDTSASFSAADKFLPTCAALGVEYVATTADDSLIEYTPRPDPTLSWNTKREQLYRLVVHAGDALTTVADVKRFGGLSLTAGGSTGLTKQVLCFTEIYEKFIDPVFAGLDLVLPESYSSWPCALYPPASNQSCRDHFHDDVSLIWPYNGLGMKMRSMIVPPMAAVTFRDFKFSRISAHCGALTHERLSICETLQSAIRAIQETMGYQWGWPCKISVTAGHKQCLAAEEAALRDARKIPELLACVGFYAWMNFELAGHSFKLGIISTGSTQVFWPAGVVIPGSDPKTIYIQAKDSYSFGPNKLTFCGK